jgi:endoglycosylceramidase
MNIFYFIVLLTFINVVINAELPSIKLKQKETGERVFIETTHGREVFLHGVNAIVKGFPYVPSTNEFDIDISLTTKDHETLKDLGVNVYRLGSMWKGLEPNRGKYNETYLNQLDLIINGSEKYDIYTLLDMHQDDFSEKFCGEGVPDWSAIESVTKDSHNFPAPVGEPFTDVSQIDGYPTRQDCAKFNWPQYYNTWAEGSAFQNLYKNTDGILDSWGKFWNKLVSTFDKYPSVLGFELINEPGAGDVISDPLLLIPSVADKNNLQPAYDSLANNIRQASKDALIFFAAVTWDDIVPNGFDHAPGGVDNAPNSVFSFHYYEPPQGNTHTYFNTRKKDSQRLQVGSMLTEFERPTSDNTNSTYFDRVANAADENLLSWTMWEYKAFCIETNETLNSDSQAAAFGACKTGYGEHLIWNIDGSQNMNASRKLARSYAQSVAGNTNMMKFNSTTGDFILSYQINLSIEAPTEIFVHKDLNYPTGYNINISPKNSLTYEIIKNKILFSPSKSCNNGEKIRIMISRL